MYRCIEEKGMLMALFQMFWIRQLHIGWTDAKATERLEDERPSSAKEFSQYPRLAQLPHWLTGDSK